MLAPNSRRYGSKIHKDNLGRVKVKSVMAVRELNSKWADMWNAWRWEAWVRPQIDVAIAAGANVVKMSASGIGPSEDGFSYPVDAVLKARIDQFIGYCQSKGVAVYWNLVAHPFYLFGSGGTLGPTNIPYIVKVAKWVDAWPNVIGIDVCNEINNSYPTTWNGPNYAQVTTDLQTAFDAVRAVTSLPLSASVLCQSVAEISGGWMQAVSTMVDTHTFHPYYLSGTPAVADLTALRAASWYKGRWFIDEIGTSIAQTSAVQSAWTTAIGTMAAQSDSFGAVLFCAADYDTVTSGQFGITDVHVQNTRTQLTTPFAAWPGTL